MRSLKVVLKRVVAEVGVHVRASKGFEEESWINPLAPVDSVAAFAVAKSLVERNLFDHCLSVAPEGHVYGFFFERLGASVLTVHVDYPPRRCDVLDDLDVVRGKRVLILEDDVASGMTLRHVVTSVTNYEPDSIDLYLGRPKDMQIIEHIDPAIRTVYVAEDVLEPARRTEYEADFVNFFDHG